MGDPPPTRLYECYSISQSFSVKADRTQVRTKPNVIWLQLTHVDDRLPDIEKELTLSLDDAIKSGTGPRRHN
jgi:hypothetical protein